MKLQYLGTAAAEGIPAIFCECDNCRKARKAGGRDIRTRSQALIDDRLLIDFPADTYMHFLQYNVPLTKIKNCIITHSHSDHLYPAELTMRKEGFAYLIEDPAPITFYSDESGFEKMLQVKTANSIPDEAVMIKQIKLNETFVVDGYNVTAIRAAHDEKSSPVVYLIEKDGKTIFYSNDTSKYPDESMEYLKTLKKPIDLVSFDCTAACQDINYVGHMNLERCIELRKILKDMGAADDNTVFILNHFSHNGENVLYDEFSMIAAKHDFKVSYDGMIVEI